MFYHHFKHVSLQHALLDASVYGCDISMRSEWDCDGDSNTAKRYQGDEHLRFGQ